MIPSNVPNVALNRSLCIMSTCACSLVAFSRATASAWRLLSVSVTSSAGSSNFAVIPRQPLPVPTSTRRPVCGPHLRRQVIIASDSGRGISTLGVTLNSRP